MGYFQLWYKRSMLRTAILALALGSWACATEHFDQLPPGELTSGQTEYGLLKAQPGHALIQKGKGRNGTQALRLLGGEKRQVRLELTQAVTQDTPFEFWMERWTREKPFSVQVSALAGRQEKVLLKVDEKFGHGTYRQQKQLTLPKGTTALVFSSTTGTSGGGGVLVDDLVLHTGTMKIDKVDISTPGVYPIMKRAKINPAARIHIAATGSLDPASLEAVSFQLDDPEQVEKVTLRTGNEQGTSFRGSKVLASAAPKANGRVDLDLAEPLESGDTWLWLDITPTDKALVGGTVSLNNIRVGVAGKEYNSDKAISQRIGYLVSVAGETVGNQPEGQPDRPCVAFRIPGMIRTDQGTLIGCFDARYKHAGDLCADIDVAAVRSTDGGQTWTRPEVAMDSGPGDGNGNGDPCILQDQKGRLWMQSLACHFKGGASLGVSQPGLDEKTTGQWVMTYSDDDGKTWSKDFVNPTRQIKKPEWTTILAGPGSGICTRKGVIVFPAQIWQRGANPRCMSTICYSKDGGKTWVYGTGVPHATSECQVAELKDGSLMLNCRNEARSGKRIVYTTKDLGKTWQAHETNNKALKEPTCQASLVTVNTKKYGRLLLFSNPCSTTGRNLMTIRTSRNEGKSWNDGYTYDDRACWGYSSIAMTDDNHVGILYESPHVSEDSDLHGIAFIRIPLETVVTGKEVPATPSKVDRPKKKAQNESKR